MTFVNSSMGHKWLFMGVQVAMPHAKVHCTLGKRALQMFSDLVPTVTKTAAARLTKSASHEWMNYDMIA